MDQLTIIPREAWGAIPPLSVNRRSFPIRYVFCISTLSTSCVLDHKCHQALRELQSYQMKNKRYRDFRYNFLIGGSGFVYEGRGWGDEPMLPVKYGRFNKSSLLLGFMGTYTEETLLPQMKQARDALIEHGIKNAYIAQGFRPYQLFDEQTNYV